MMKDNGSLRKFLIRNRYGENYFLQEFSPGLFQLKGDQEFMRVIFSEDGNSIYAIDPPGGPFMAIDTEIKKGLFIKEISFDEEHGTVLKIKGKK